jgi:hypothetical protein
MAIEGAITVDRTGSIWRCNGLTAKYPLNTHRLAISFTPVVFSEAVAHLRQQRVVRDAGQVLHVYEVRQSFATCSTHRNKTDFVLHSPVGQTDLGFDLIAGINHSIW